MKNTKRELKKRSTSSKKKRKTIEATSTTTTVHENTSVKFKIPQGDPFQLFDMASDPISPNKTGFSPRTQQGRVVFGDDVRPLLVGAKNASQMLSMAERKEKVAVSIYLNRNDYLLPGTDVNQGVIGLDGCLPKGGSKMQLHLKYCTANEARNMENALASLTEAIKNGFQDSLRGMGKRTAVDNNRDYVRDYCRRAIRR
jgi:hypothetical protein